MALGVYRFNSCRTILGLLLILHNVGADAAGSCDSVFSKRQHLPQVVQIDTNFQGNDARLISHVIHKIQSFTGSLRKPDTKVVDNQDSYLGSSYHGEHDSILFRMAKNRNMRIHSLTILAHEYGHAFFEKNLTFSIAGQLRTMPEAFRDANRIYEEAVSNPNYKALKAELMLLQQRFHSLTPQERIIFDAKTDELNSMYRERTSGLAELREKVSSFKFITTPYSELFADTVGVMFAGNGRAVADALKLPENSPFDLRDESGQNILTTYRAEDNLNLRPRDFTVNTASKEFLPDMRQNSRGIIYTALDPVRSHIWTNYLVNAQRYEYELILRAILVATREQVLLRLERKETDIFQLNFEKINQEFIRLFDSAIKIERLKAAS